MQTIRAPFPTQEQVCSQSFFAPTADEARYRDEAFYARLRARWDNGKTLYIGDKLPNYLRRHGQMRAEFPECRLIVLLRDLEPIAASYNARKARAGDDWNADYRDAVLRWNVSLEDTKSALEQSPDLVYPVYQRTM